LRRAVYHRTLGAYQICVGISPRHLAHGNNHYRVLNSYGTRLLKVMQRTFIHCSARGMDSRLRATVAR
jgi:hypothetical protein